MGGLQDQTAGFLQGLLPAFVATLSKLPFRIWHVLWAGLHERRGSHLQRHRSLLRLGATEVAPSPRCYMWRLLRRRLWRLRPRFAMKVSFHRVGESHVGYLRRRPRAFRVPDCVHGLYNPRRPFLLRLAMEVPYRSVSGCSIPVTRGISGDTPAGTVGGFAGAPPG
jgi:hypothetical protein